MTTKGPRLSSKEGWERWKVWFRAQLYIHNCKDQFKDGGDVATLNKLYGILASSIDGEAVTIVSNLNKEGDGFAAYEALEKAFGDHRKVLLTHRLREAITRKQNPNVSAKDYLLQKRDHFSKVEAAFANDHAKLWEYAKVVAIITCLSDEKLIDFLLMELARNEAANNPLDYNTVELTIQTFADGRGNTAAQSTVALSAEDKPKGKGKGGGSALKSGFYSGGWQGYGQQNSSGGHGYGQWYWKRGKASGGKGKGRGKGGKGKKKAGKGKGKTGTSDSANAAEEAWQDQDNWWWSSDEDQWYFNHPINGWQPEAINEEEPTYTGFGSIDSDEDDDRLLAGFEVMNFVGEHDNSYMDSGTDPDTDASIPMWHPKPLVQGAQAL